MMKKTPYDGSCCGYRWLSESSTARAIQILLVAITLIMAIVNALCVLPMFLSMDSNKVGAIMARAGLSSSSGGGGTMEQPGGGGTLDVMGMHHGVHKNLLEHKLGLQEHMETFFGKQKDDEPPSPLSSMGGGEANDADARNRPVTATATAAQVVPWVLKLPCPTRVPNGGRDRGWKLAREFSGLPMDRTPALIGVKRKDVKADIGNRTCWYSEDVALGEWIAPDRWKPRKSECEYEYFTDVEFGSCLALRYRRIAFFGDSLLLNVFVELTRRLTEAGHGTLEPRPVDFYTPGGHQEFVFEGKSSSSFALDKDDANATTTGDGGDDDDRRRLVFWWTPSSFHANIHHYEKEFDTLDAAMFGMAAWSVA